MAKHEFEGSSVLKSAEHDEKTNTLTIEFNNGGTYRYPDCHVSHFNNLISVDSPGSYFHSRIKNKFGGVKV